MAEHTKGRAQICGQFTDRTFVCIGRDCVAKFDHGDNNLPHAENAARMVLAWNAHPELLEALKAAEQCIGELPPTQSRVETMHLVQAAIAKATGATA